MCVSTFLFSFGDFPYESSKKKGKATKIYWVPTVSKPVGQAVGGAGGGCGRFNLIFIALRRWCH